MNRSCSGIKCHLGVSDISHQSSTTGWKFTAFLLYSVENFTISNLASLLSDMTSCSQESRAQELEISQLIHRVASGINMENSNSWCFNSHEPENTNLCLFLTPVILTFRIAAQRSLGLCLSLNRRHVPSLKLIDQKVLRKKIWEHHLEDGLCMGIMQYILLHVGVGQDTGKKT